MTGRLRCERATAAHGEGLLALFEAAGSGCFCNYWHFEGDKNAWLERCYLRPEENRAALLERLAGSELCGVVAVASNDDEHEGGVGAPPTNQDSGAGAPPTNETKASLCGWLKLTRARTIARLYDQRVYRNLPCFQSSPGDREHVYAVGCCYVAEAQRGQGVTRELLKVAIEVARQAGGSALEAFPRGLPEGQDGAARLRPDEIWMGPGALFLQAGFTQVSDFRPYPVLRLHLR
jgi:GNAT superfamily N-acetyltransferase